MPEDCAVHDLMVQRFEDRFDVLSRQGQENGAKLDMLLDRERAAAQSDATDREKISQLANSDEKQWQAIDSLKKDVYFGVGAATALAVGIPIALKLAEIFK